MKRFYLKHILFILLSSLFLGINLSSAQSNLAERDKAFKRKCELNQSTGETTEACMRYFRSVHKDKYSRKDCERDPSSEICQHKLQRSEKESYRKSDTSSDREFTAFCKKNREAPRCARYLKKKTRHKKASSRIQRLNSAEN